MAFASQAARPSTVVATRAALLSRVRGTVQPPPVAGAPGREQQRRQQAGPLSAARVSCSAQQEEKEQHSVRRAPEIYLGVPGGSNSSGSTGDGSIMLRAPGLLAAAAAALLAAPAPAEAAPSLQDAVGGIEQLVQDAGALGPLVFVAAYVAATVLLVPGSLLTLAAGFLFGPVLGTAVVSVASTAGASAAFLVGRYLARPAVERRIQDNPRFSAVDAAIGRQGAKIVLLLRLSPLFPFTLLNYALSLTKIEFLPYVLASWAGMLPGTVAYVALGGAGKAAAETAAGGGAGALQLVLYAVGAGATLWATALISKAASKALEEASGEAGGGAETDAAAPLRKQDSSE